jgi:hypothetical protein
MQTAFSFNIRDDVPLVLRPKALANSSVVSLCRNIVRKRGFIGRFVKRADAFARALRQFVAIAGRIGL